MSLLVSPFFYPFTVDIAKLKLFIHYLFIFIVNITRRCPERVE